jgi:hypothetical protein
VINTTNVGAPATDLQVALPAGYTVAAAFGTTCLYVDAGGPLSIGLATGSAGGTTVHFRTLSLSPWVPTGVNNTSLNAMLTFEVTG